MIPSATLAKRYLRLRPVAPAEYYEHPQPLVRAQAEYDDERSDSGFHAVFGLDLRGKDVLDLGCGFGGRTVYYKEIGARSVTGVEVDSDTALEALEFAAYRNATIQALKGVGEAIPLPPESVDAITSYDVFEHVESLPKTLAECYRVLRLGGVLYAIFPPFYHPTGGSHLHGYVSTSPAPNLLFTCPALRKAIEELLNERKSTYRPTYRPLDPLPSVNGTTVTGFFEMLRDVPFSASIKLRPLHSSRFSWLNWMPSLGVKIPLLREICTSRLVCRLRK